MIIAYIFAVLLLLWFIYPLFQFDERRIISVDGESDKLEYLKSRVYKNIKELEFDYAMGRLSDDDFNRIRQKFLSEASVVLQKLDKIEQKDYSMMIQEDLDKITSTEETLYCPSCGASNPEHAKFCISCGGKI